MNSSPLQSALQSAPVRGSTAVPRPEQELFCFRVGGLNLAFPTAHVREVVRLTSLTPLPRTPPFVLGVMGHRGEVLPVVDVLRFIGKGEVKPGPRSRVLVGVSSNLLAAFIADSVAGMARVPTANVLPPPLGNDGTDEHFLGVVPPADGNEALHVVNLPRLLQSIRQRVVGR